MTTEVDTKIVERVRKLMAKAKDGAVTEAEASAFAAKAAEIMEEYGLSMMAVETSGGEAEGRERGSTRADLRGSFYPVVMRAVAESCFCWLDVSKNRDDRKWEFTLIGRRSSVTTANLTYEYLVSTINRIAREEKPASNHQFCCGMSERIAERLKKRHADRLREQKEEAEKRAREEATHSRHPSSAPTSTALVVTLVDYELRERELNEDFRRGWPAGTTESRRREKEAKDAADARRMKELQERGLSYGVAFNIVYLNMTEERAVEFEREWLAKQEKEARRRDSRGQRRSSWTGADQRAYDRDRREEARRSSPSWQQGREAGESVGLDTQVEKKEGRRLS